MTHFVTNYNNNHVTTSYNIVNWIYLTNSVQCFLATATCFLEEIMCWKRSVDVSQDHLLVRRVLHSANTSLTTFHWRSSKLTTFKLHCIKQSTYLPLGTHVFCGLDVLPVTQTKALKKTKQWSNQSPHMHSVPTEEMPKLNNNNNDRLTAFDPGQPG